MTELSTSVKTLCTGQFQTLRVYFPEQLTVADLLRVSEFEALEDVEHKDRLLMRLFWRTYVEPTRSVLQDPFAMSARHTADIVLNLSDLVSPASLKSFQPDKISTDALKNIVKAKDVEAIKIVDLSCNNLLDDDLKYLVPFLLDLPKIEIVDLSNNRLHGYRDMESVIRYLLQLLQKASLRHLDITVNALASYDGMPFFSELVKKENRSEFLKLIWISQAHLAGGSWNAIVPVDVRGDVLKAHLAYYALSWK